ncbi:MAG TPA: acyl-CoA dehydrogenase family protein [Nitriliruptorales bacterium]
MAFTETFNEEHEAFRATVRRFVEEEVNPHVEDWEAAGMMPLHDLFAAMAKLGMIGLDFDPAYGGGGADHVFTVVLAEEFGRADHGSLPMALGVQTNMATPSLHDHGSDELKEAYLAPALRGEMVAAIAVTEPDAGSDVAGITTRARRDGDDWVISGSKMYITNALQADWMCLLARTSDEGGYRGMSQIVVETDSPGFEVSRKLDKLGMRASDTGLLTFDEVRVPVSNTIGIEGRGFQQQMSQFVVERMWAVYSTATACELALQRTAQYGRERRIFGKQLIDNQYIQYRLAELAAEVDLLKVYNHRIATRYAAGLDVTREATIAKLKAGRLHREIADWTMQFHGGIGYMEETWTARFLRDGRLTSIGGGSDETMLRVLSMIDGFVPSGD